MTSSRWLWAMVVLIAMVLGTLPMRPPLPISADAPPSEFSADVLDGSSPDSWCVRLSDGPVDRLVVSNLLPKGDTVPGGSDYQGPADALVRYTAVVEGAGEAVKGAKNPYTSRNGHMYSFLDAEGGMALRLSDELTDDFLSEYESGPVMQYGSVMRGYVSVPDHLLSNAEEAGSWFTKSFDWIGTLEPKPTKK